KHRVAWSHVSLRLAVTLETPFHEQRVLAPHDRHLIDLSVTRRATDSFGHVNAVIEVHEVGEVVHSRPAQWGVRAKACPNGLERGTRGSDLRMTAHAGVRRREPCEGGGLDRRVAVAAVDTDSRHMVLVAERNWLGSDDVDFGSGNPRGRRRSTAS